MKTNKILCMGSINIDLVMYLSKLPLPGETVVTDNFQEFPGGKGGNQASAASLLGGNVKYFTKLGSDVFSKQLTEEQVKNKVDMTDVLYLKNETAGIAMIRVDEQGQNSISFTPGANSLLTSEDVKENHHIFDQCKILLITMEISTDTVYSAIKVAKEKGLTVVLDPAPAPPEGIPDEIAQLVDFVKPNETEAEILTGIKVTDRKSASLALQVLIKKGFKNPIITLSDRGALAAIEGEEYFVEPLKVTSVDTTAAGDIFLGAFAASLSLDKNIKDCLEFASVAGALSTTIKGAQSSIPVIEKINEHI